MKLPKIKVFRSKRKEVELLQKLRDRVESFARKVEDPIHISDILAPKKGYWQRVLPKRLDDTSIMFFSLGYAGHEYLLGQDDEGAKTTSLKDLVYSPDKLEKRTVQVDEGGKYHHEYVETTAVIEVKITTKRTVATTRSELHKYTEQLLSYMAFETVEKGELWIWYVSPNGPPEIAVFTVEATKHALTKYKKQILDKAKELRQALTDKDPSGLELCEKNLCYRSKCQWYDDCKPEGRWKPKKIQDHE